MKLPIVMAVLSGLFLLAGCSSTATNDAEKDAYYEEGEMTEQVESWKKHGRY